MNHQQIRVGAGLPSMSKHPNENQRVRPLSPRRRTCRFDSSNATISYCLPRVSASGRAPTLTQVIHLLMLLSNLYGTNANRACARSGAIGKYPLTQTRKTAGRLHPPAVSFSFARIFSHVGER